MCNHPVFLCRPQKETPEGCAAGAFGQISAARMERYVVGLQAHGATPMMITKGNRSRCHS
ncbi:fumarate hydratase C-terminal domain-containing protein [Leisingera daeponensis]|uniref:fumarate hydratase C-terminal domain-containing protein n=1 Tax=Leisingera daeponensis TaxID=405746 RepID=UPI003965728A